MDYSTPGFIFTISRSLLKLMSIESVLLSNHLILCHPLLLLPSVFPSIGVFSNKLALFIRWPKCWNFSISSLNEYSGLISFKIDWFDLFFQSKGLSRVFSNTTVRKHQFFGTFFTGQLSHPYMTTGKTIVLTLQTFVGQMISLLFHMLSRFVIVFSSKEQASF